MRSAWLRWLWAVPGGVYVVTGLWPVIHLASFEAVTGPKHDDFLVHTVGLLLALIGAVLLRALSRARSVVPELIWLAAGTAGILLTIDVVYWRNGRLATVYLLDAAMEAV